ncbi:MAG: hypothetical protein ACRCZK_01225 [Oscillospiraceae bacterium]
MQENLDKHINKKEVFSNYALATNLCSGRLSHSLILNGQNTDVIENIALKVSAYLLCKNDGCFTCNNCENVLKSNHPDVFLIEKDINKTEITIDKIRQMKKTVNLLPMSSKGKVYIIKNADQLNVNSQNALLKVLEEPCDDIYFILTTSKINVILETVISRCSVYDIEDENYMLESKNFDEFMIDILKNVDEEVRCDIYKCIYNSFIYILKKDYNNLLSSLTSIYMQKNKEYIKMSLTVLKVMLKSILKTLINNFLLPDDIKVAADCKNEDKFKYIEIYNILLNEEESLLTNVNLGLSSTNLFISIKCVLEA